MAIPATAINQFLLKVQSTVSVRRLESFDLSSRKSLMIRHVQLMLALVTAFTAAGCATNRGNQGWAPPPSPFSSGSDSGSCPSCG